MTQIFAVCCIFGSRGRVVKATDLKSVGSPRAGSNPADYDWHFFSLFLFKIILVQKDKRRKSLLLVVHSVVVAEWLRRQTRNLLGSPRAGSNPADYDWHFFSLFLFKIILVQKDKWRKSLLLVVHSVVVAEWLRRQTRNLLGSPAQVQILPTTIDTSSSSFRLKSFSSERQVTQIFATCCPFGSRGRVVKATD